MKVILYMLLTLAAGFILVFGAGLFVVAQFSAVYDPIEVYDYHATQKEVMTAIDSVVKRSRAFIAKSRIRLVRRKGVSTITLRWISKKIIYKMNTVSGYLGSTNVLFGTSLKNYPILK